MLSKDDMPVLIKSAQYISDKTGKILQKTGILFCQHIDQPTYELFVNLHNFFGLKYTNCYGLDKIYSIIKKDESKMRNLGIKMLTVDYSKYEDVIDIYGYTQKVSCKFLEKSLKDLSEKVGKEIDTVIILDDGGDITSAFMKSKKLSPDSQITKKMQDYCKIIFEKAKVVFAEQTSNGLYHIITEVFDREISREGALEVVYGENLLKHIKDTGEVRQSDISMVKNWDGIIAGNRSIYTGSVVCTASSAVKNLVEPSFVRESGLYKLTTLIPVLQQGGKIVGVIGLGNIGTAIAEFCKEKNTVLTCDLDEKRKNKISGAKSVDICVLVEESDYIMCCTGCDSSKDYAEKFVEIFEKSKINKTVMSFSSWNIEFRSLLKLKDKHGKLIFKRITNHDEKQIGKLPTPLLPLEYKNKHGASFKILYGGCPINFRPVCDLKSGKIRQHSIDPVKFQLISSLLLWSVIQGYLGVHSKGDQRQAKRLYNYLERIHPSAQKYLMHLFCKLEPEIIKQFPKILDCLEIFNNPNEIDVKSSYQFMMRVDNTGGWNGLTTGIGQYGLLCEIYQKKYDEDVNKVFPEKELKMFSIKVPKVCVFPEESKIIDPPYVRFIRNYEASEYDLVKESNNLGNGLNNISKNFVNGNMLFVNKGKIEELPIVKAKKNVVGGNMVVYQNTNTEDTTGSNAIENALDSMFPKKKSFPGNCK